MRFRNRYVLLTDILLIIVAVMGSYILRLELLEDFLRYYWQGALWWIAVALVIKPIVYYFFGLYRRLWIYASISELKLIAAAVTTSSLLVAAIVLTLYSFQVFGPGFSRSALAIDWLLSLVLVGGARIALRIVAESSIPRADGKRRDVLVIGAGDAGALVVREMQKSRQMNMNPVGFLDDDPAKRGQILLGDRKSVV